MRFRNEPNCRVNAHRMVYGRAAAAVTSGRRVEVAGSAETRMECLSRAGSQSSMFFGTLRLRRIIASIARSGSTRLSGMSSLAIALTR